jgi:hypothetical protein
LRLPNEKGNLSRETTVYPPSRPPPSPPPIPHAAEPAANPACSRARHRASHWPIQTCRPPRPGSPTLEPAKFRCYSAIQQNFDVSSLYSGLYTAKIRCIALYTDTRCVTALRSYTAIQRYTLYSCTALYTIYVYNLYNPPLSLCVFPSTRTAHTLCAPASASASLYKRRRRQFPLHSRDRLEFNPWRFSLERAVGDDRFVSCQTCRQRVSPSRWPAGGEVRQGSRSRRCRRERPRRWRTTHVRQTGGRRPARTGGQV